MSDYLWDPSAEADPDVEEFEEALSHIRYRPGIPELPEPLEKAFQERRPGRSPQLLAAAAALAFMLLASGLWLGWQTNQRRAHPAQVANSNESFGAPDEIAKGEETAGQSGNEMQQMKGTVQLQKPLRDVWRCAPVRKRRVITDGGYEVRSPSAIQPVTKAPEQNLYASNAANGEAAKEQIMLALQISSAKLSLAQRLAQGTAARQSKLNP
jgi:hypothetical protein